jgi:predicted HTH domain antitoxin
MAIHLDIPESVVSGLRLPAPEVQSRLLTELAVALYAQDILSFGKACELAGSSRYVFAELLTRRNISRHYTEEDLALDLDYARGE